MRIINKLFERHRQENRRIHVLVESYEQYRNRMQLTNHPSFTVEPSVAPGPSILQTTFNEVMYTLGQYNADSISVSSTIEFYENGIAKHTIKQYKDGSLTCSSEGWYDRQISDQLYSEFRSFKSEEWVEDQTDGFVMMDGAEWKLNTVQKDGSNKISYGYTGFNEMANFEQVRIFFGLPSTYKRETEQKSQETPQLVPCSREQYIALLKFITTYLMFPFICFLLFLVWVWVYFGAK